MHHLTTAARRRAALLAATTLLAPAQAFAQSAVSAATAPASNPPTTVTPQQVEGSPPPQTPRTDSLTPGTETNDDTLPQRSDDIVVTGTLVRGVAPPGASPITADQRYIRSTGANSVAQLLQTIPQLNSFNTLQVPLAQSPEVTTNRPNLRNLPNANTFGGATTLVLVDGHRVVGMGNGSTEPDPDVLPPGIIDRVEIVPDGGSAQYGSDAVAGVINFITLRRFNGVRADGSYGFANDYWRYDANLTVGRDWGSGSIYASYSYARNNNLLGRDRDFVRQFPGSNGLISLQCSPGNIEVLGTSRVVGLPVGTATAPNQCDSSDNQSLYPASRRHSVFAGLTQDLAPGLTFELRGFYTNRKTEIATGPATFSEFVSPPALAPILSGIIGLNVIGSPFDNFGSPNMISAVEQVDGRIQGSDYVARAELDTWSISPAITADLGHTFRLRVQTTYGESTARFIADATNEAALQNAIRTGLFNPFAPGTSDPQAVAAVRNFEQFNRTRQRQFDVKGTIDGDLFHLPAGAVKIAIGGEYLEERFIANNGAVVPGYEYGGYPGTSINGNLIVPATPGTFHFDLSRHVASAFGEVVAPIFGGGGGPSLTISVAGRYDHYSDVGDTFNPRFGATFKPISWISIRGAWGRSFNAPSLADQPGSAITTGFILSGAAAGAFAPPAGIGFPAYDGRAIVAVRGNSSGIQPQKATTWNAGFDIQPPFVPGLNIGATYFNINYRNLIGLAPFENPSLLYAQYPGLVTVNPSQAFLDAQLAGVNVYGIGSPPVSASAVYAFLDARKRNLGRYKLDGIDFRLNYQHRVSFGTLLANFNGTYDLDRANSPTLNGAYSDVLQYNASRFRGRTSVGAEVGPVLGQIVWNHTAGYRLNPVVGFVPQYRVGAFNTFDLFFRIAVPNISVTHDTALTINIDNLFDQDPPEYRASNPVGGQQGTINGVTIGRFVRFGLSTRF